MTRVTFDNTPSQADEVLGRRTAVVRAEEDKPDLYKGRTEWFGYLTKLNGREVYYALRELLIGKTYTWVAVNENLDLLHPEVRTGQRIKDDTAISFSDDEKQGPHILVSDSYGVWGIHSALPSERVASLEGTKVGMHHMADPDLKHRGDYDHVYLVFKRDREVRICQRTAAGGRITWVIAIEEENQPRAEAERDILAKALDYLLLAVTHEFAGTQRKEAITDAQAVLRDVCGVGPGPEAELTATAIGEAPDA